MATFDDVLRKIDSLTANIKKHAPGIVAETATEHFKERFRGKDWDGVPWAQTKQSNSKGSLMVRSGALMSTVRPTLVTEDEVRIGAGNAKVPYARIHNEGGMIRQTVTEKQRRFFWAMELKDNPKAEEDTDHKVGMWGKMATKQQLTITIPQRQFMGRSPAMMDKITERLQALAKQSFNK